MPLADYSELIVQLPVAARQEIFGSGRHFSTPFLSALVKHLDTTYSDGMDNDTVRQMTQIRLKQQDFIYQYADDFFENGLDGKPAIPDSVFEVLAPRLDLLRPDEWGDNYSAGAQAILADLFKLRNDPYPKEEAYASPAARFCCLYSQCHASIEFLQRFINGMADDQEVRTWKSRMLSPFRTLEPKASKLEDFIVGNVKLAEFMMEFEDEPYHWPLEVIRGINDNPEATAGYILGQSGVPSAPLTAYALEYLTSLQMHEYYRSGAETWYHTLQFNVAPVRMFMDFYPDAQDDIILFGLLASELVDKEKRETLGNHIPEETFAYLKACHNFVEEQQKQSANSSFETLRARFKGTTISEAPESANPDENSSEERFSPEMQAQIMDMIACINYSKLERISLFLDQDPMTVLDLEQEMIMNKAHLLKVKEHFMQIPVEGQSADLREFVDELLVDCWRRFDYLSRFQTIGRRPIQFAEGEHGNEPV